MDTHIPQNFILHIYNNNREKYGSQKNWNFWLITNLMLIIKIVICINIDNLIWPYLYIDYKYELSTCIINWFWITPKTSLLLLDSILVHHEVNGWRVFTNNKLDRIIVGKSESNTMRFVVIIVVVVFINIIRKRHWWHG